MEQTELSAILYIVKSCSVKPPVASPSCNVNTAATECYPRLSVQCESSDPMTLKTVQCELGISEKVPKLKLKNY